MMREIIIEEQDDKEAFESLYVRRANYYETDKMGIIHHSNYIRWFEEARLRYMEEMGWPFTKVEAMGIVIPVLSVDCQYKSMVRYDDIVDIYTKLPNSADVQNDHCLSGGWFRRQGSFGVPERRPIVS